MAVVNPQQTELAQVRFSNLIEGLLQSGSANLRQFVRSNGGYRGRTAQPVNYIGPVRFGPAGDRGDRLKITYAQFQARYVNPTPHELTIQVDSFDDLVGLADVKSPIVMEVEKAVAVAFDDAIIPAFFGTATIGPENATTTETFNSGLNFPVSVTVADTVGAGVETGVSVAKILQGKFILSKYENNLDQMRVHMGMTAQGELDLLSSAEFVSTDYRATAVYDEVGRVKMFKGVEFHYSERWPYAASDSDERYLPMWTEDGMHLGIWDEATTNVTQETGLVSQPWQLYARLVMGATRLQAGKVVRISVLDTTGGPVLG